MTRIELKEYLVNEAEYETSEVAKMSNRDMLDAWLTYNGIIGYTSDIIEVLEAVGIKYKWY